LIIALETFHDSCYPLLDTLPRGRIIKDVMRHQLGDGEEGKKRLTAADGLNAGSEPGDSADTLADDEIDPADFFDPEEFGIRRRGFNASHP
jgi:hypothetical protein